MEWTDTVTFILTKEGAYVFNSQLTSGMSFMNTTKITADILFKEGDVYKTKLWELLKLFRRIDIDWFPSRPLFTNMQVIKEESEE